MWKRIHNAVYWLLTFLVLCGPAAVYAGLEVKVLREDLIDPAIPKFNNGSSPNWNFGSPMIVRQGEEVWFSLSRPVERIPPYANTTWKIYRRTKSGWEVILEAPESREREPCPLVRLNDYTLAVFTNPKVSFNRFRTENRAVLWNSRPYLLAFGSASDIPEPFEIDPVFSGNPVLREHTYRAIGVDPKSSEVLVLVQDPESELYHPSFLDSEGQWHPKPPMAFKQRSLYANVFIRDRAAHVLATSDIQEPVPEWRAAKYREFQRHWDYAYRNMVYTWSEDVVAKGFREPILVESIADRPGHLRNLDLLVDEAGDVHVLYRKQVFQYGFLRDEFFPGEPMEASIGYARIRDGKVLLKTDVVTGLMEPDLSLKGGVGEPTWGRLHQLADGAIVAIYSLWKDGEKSTWIARIDEEGKAVEPVKVPLEHPVGSVFFTNTMRGGSEPGNRIDLLEITWGEEAHEVRYAEIEVSR